MQIGYIPNNTLLFTEKESSSPLFPAMAANARKAQSTWAPTTPDPNYHELIELNLLKHELILDYRENQTIIRVYPQQKATISYPWDVMFEQMPDIGIGFEKKVILQVDKEGFQLKTGKDLYNLIPFEEKIYTLADDEEYFEVILTRSLDPEEYPKVRLGVYYQSFDVPKNPEEPEDTDTPEDTQTPEETLEDTDTPEDTQTPEETHTAEETLIPEDYQTPEETLSPEDTDTPEDTNTPVDTQTPEETQTPVITTPEITTPQVSGMHLENNQTLQGFIELIEE